MEAQLLCRWRGKEKQVNLRHNVICFFEGDLCVARTSRPPSGEMVAKELQNNYIPTSIDSRPSGIRDYLDSHRWRQ